MNAESIIKDFINKSMLPCRIPMGALAPGEEPVFPKTLETLFPDVSRRDAILNDRKLFDFVRKVMGMGGRPVSPIDIIKANAYMHLEFAQCLRYRSWLARCDIKLEDAEYLEELLWIKSYCPDDFLYPDNLANIVRGFSGAIIEKYLKAPEGYEKVTLESKVYENAEADFQAGSFVSNYSREIWAYSKEGYFYDILDPINGITKENVSTVFRRVRFAMANDIVVKLIMAAANYIVPAFICDGRLTVFVKKDRELEFRNEYTHGFVASKTSALESYETVDVFSQAQLDGLLERNADVRLNIRFGDHLKCAELNGDYKAKIGEGFRARARGRGHIEAQGNARVLIMDDVTVSAKESAVIISGSSGMIYAHDDVVVISAGAGNITHERSVICTSGELIGLEFSGKDYEL
jgi:hypothetical protein